MRIMFACAIAFAWYAVGAAPNAGAIPGYDSCAPYGGYQIDVRGVACDEAWVVDAYDWEGDKFQSIADYDCYSGTVDVKPIVLTCVSQDGELVVSE